MADNDNAPDDTLDAAGDSAGAQAVRGARVRREEARAEYRRFQAVQARRAGRVGSRPGESAAAARARRLRMNQESSARTRYADRVYQTTLEALVARSEAAQRTLAARAAAGRERTHALAGQVLALQDALAAARGSDEGAEREAKEAEREQEEACSTRRLLELTRGVPECRMTPEAFAQSLMGVPACPAL